MPIPTQAEAIAILERGHAELSSLLARIPDQDLVRPDTIGGGHWSAKDLLGHIAFWEEQALGFIDDWQAGRTPAISAIVASGSDGIDAANARDQSVTQGHSVQDVQKRAKAAHARLFDAIRTIPDGVWSAKPYYPSSRSSNTFAELLGGIVGGPDRPFEHANEHLRDLKAFIELLETTAQSP